MTYRDTILADLPSHYWPLAEPGGTLVSDLIDPAGTGLSLASSVGFKGCAVGEGAALINNVNNNAYLGLQSKRYLTAPCSLECWAYLWALTGTYQVCLMYGASLSSIEIGILASGKVYVWSRNVAPTFGVQSTANMPLNQWVHLVASVGTLNTSIHINGVLDSTQPLTLNLPASGPFGIGGFSDRTQSVNGFVGSPALYTVSLGTPAIAAHYAAADQASSAPVFIGAASGQQLIAAQSTLDRILAAVTYVAH